MKKRKKNWCGKQKKYLVLKRHHLIHINQIKQPPLLLLDLSVNCQFQFSKMSMFFLTDQPLDGW